MNRNCFRKSLNKSMNIKRKLNNIKKKLLKQWINVNKI